MQQIPKIIHYCWFGNNDKPEIVLRCIESWKKYMPDYEIIEWNEENYDVHKVNYIAEAYKAKKWAFVSDYARFDVLYHQGGIYFDTDVELLRAIPNEILSHKAFTGLEYAGNVNPGLVYGCCAGDTVAQKMLHSYELDSFDINQLKTVNIRITDILLQDGFVPGLQEYQEVGNLAIYPSEVFCSYDQDVRELKITDKSVSVHHYASSWTNKTIKQRLRPVLKKLFGVEGYRRMLIFKRALKNMINKIGVNKKGKGL